MPAAAVPEPASPGKQHCRLGPWGAIEYYEIVTRPPDEFISPSFFTEATQQWVFKGYSRAAMDELLAAAGLTPAQRSALDGSTQVSASQCVVKPSDDLVLGLSPGARARIYAVLARFPENPTQRDPFAFRATQIQGWLENSALARPAVDMVRRVLYPHDDLLLLSDCGTVMRQLPDADERTRLFRILFRRPAVFPQLRVAADSDLKALTQYWGKGGRSTVIGPLLESLPQTAAGVTVDVSLLLPVFARERLYTYPTPSTNTQGVSRDCHWTALNFFNETPDDRYGRPEVIVSTIEKDYYPVPGNPSFGDLVLVHALDRTIVHSAVFIADDILFTKNGPSFTSPWLLMTQAEVLASFPAYEKLSVTYCRLKKL